MYQWSIILSSFYLNMKESFDRKDVREKNDANWGFPSIHDSFVGNGLDFFKKINFFIRKQNPFLKR